LNVPSLLFGGLCRTTIVDREKGEQRYGVTSLADLGLPVSMAEVDMMLRREFEAVFGPTSN
jgi:lipoate-protein ligase B